MLKYNICEYTHRSAICRRGTKWRCADETVEDIDYNVRDQTCHENHCSRASGSKFS
jgi:hypothetical protein